jgi:predicted O-methyltransferase YrrM
MFSEVGAGDPEDYNLFPLFSDTDRNSTRLWMTVLYGLVRTNGWKSLVELGVMNGVTTCVLGQAAKKNEGRLLSIDVDPAAIERAEARVRKHGLEGYVRLAVAESSGWKPAGQVEFLFIDGDHRYSGCKADWQTWSPQVVVGGIVAMHDTGDPQVMQVVQEVNQRKWNVMNFVGDCGLAFLQRVTE